MPHIVCFVLFVNSLPGTAATLHEPNSLAADVLTLVDTRLALMPEVAAAKWASGQAISDPAREAAVIRAAGERAAALGLARAPVEALFTLQVGLARDAQQALHARWRRDGTAPRDPPPSLANDLRPRIDQLTSDLLMALYLAAPVLASADLGALASERLPRSRWDIADQARLLDALAAIRFDAACSPARARAAGVLRIGTPADYAPFAREQGGRLDGSDVDLAEGLAASLGLRPVFVHSRWGALVDDLEADHFDIGVGGVSITDARRLRAQFSGPVAHGGKTAIGRCADRAKYRQFADIDHAGVRVIENPGGTNEAFARARLQQAVLTLHPDNRTIMDELVADHADVMFTDDTEVELVSRHVPSLCRLLATLYDPSDKAFLLPHDGGWTSDVDAWLRQATADGIPAAALQHHLSD